MSKFKNLRIWQESRQITIEIFNIFRNSKEFSIKDQILRATISIINNIAEGCEAGSDNLFVRYLQIAKGSCAEVKSMLYISEDLGLCEPKQAEELRIKINQNILSIQKMIQYLKKNNPN